ncbi:hypothetical protein ACFT8W_24320 [Streptomyces hygroscopicus]|uniref:hypothetical protein n=1 Tax=Streptomyces hygroscopicus TaxID=1912 RepID=UPI003637F266
MATEFVSAVSAGGAAVVAAGGDHGATYAIMFEIVCATALSTARKRDAPGNHT